MHSADLDGIMNIYIIDVNLELLTNTLLFTILVPFKIVNKLLPQQYILTTYGPSVTRHFHTHESCKCEVCHYTAKGFRLCKLPYNKPDRKVKTFFSGINYFKYPEYFLS